MSKIKRELKVIPWDRVQTKHKMFIFLSLHHINLFILSKKKHMTKKIKTLTQLLLLQHHREFKILTFYSTLLSVHTSGIHRLLQAIRIQRAWSTPRKKVGAQATTVTWLANTIGFLNEL